MSRLAFVHTDEEPDVAVCQACWWAFPKTGVCQECGEEVAP